LKDPQKNKIDHNHLRKDGGRKTSPKLSGKKEKRIGNDKEKGKRKLTTQKKGGGNVQT